MVTAAANAAAGSALEVVVGPIPAPDPADTVEVHIDHSFAFLSLKKCFF